MKWKFSLLLVLIGFKSISQELPTNPGGSVFIKDSVETNDKSLQDVKDILSKWAYTLIDEGNVNNVFNLDNSKQTERVSINLPLWSVLTQDIGGNRFVSNGTLTYSKTKTKGLAPTATFGSVKFRFTYTITTNKLLYEFVNLEYSKDMVHYGKFEEERPPSDNYNSSLLFKMSKKEWAAVKTEYFDKLKILAANLKEFTANLLKSNQTLTNKSPINYESYKMITTGMSYDDVVKILADEGKELSNTSAQVNGKTVSKKTIVWNDLDKTKNITITFENNKVISKFQNNL